MPLLRLDKILSDAGIGTRSTVKQIVKNGRVTVDNKRITDSSIKVDTAVEICVDGKSISYCKYVYIMLNKPDGVISATEDKTEKTVLELLKPPYSKMKLFPVGRLDKDTVGLIILTNDGEFAHSSLSPKRHVAKTYYVEAEGHFSQNIDTDFNNGIVLEDGYVCKSAKINILSLTDELIKAELTITEGKYHQIKRMFAALGGKVSFLKRVSFGGIRLDEALSQGDYRLLNSNELEFINTLKQEN